MLEEGLIYVAGDIDFRGSLGQAVNSKIFFFRLWTSPNVVAIRRAPFRRSSAVEQLTVNQLVVGSIPTAGAKNLVRD